ncbi:MAG TPA: hypothetical protein VHO66_00315 [Ruminiclostridium sp.]|nr:hypothetical protein [Ruminiclostridium sp.]
MKSLFSNKDDGSCAICAHGRAANDGIKILCQKKGIVDASFCCRRYKYDPLKRVPHHAPALPKFDKSDFEL